MKLVNPILLATALALAPVLAAAQAQPPQPVEEAPLPEKVPPLPSEEDIPTVNIRRDAQTGDVVEEYRINGQLYMVKVTPRRGPSYYIRDTTGNGRLDRSDDLNRVRPVYFKLYEWD